MAKTISVSDMAIQSLLGWTEWNNYIFPKTLGGTHRDKFNKISQPITDY